MVNISVFSLMIKRICFVKKGDLVLVVFGVEKYKFKYEYERCMLSENKCWFKYKNKRVVVFSFFL